jgi:diguanylate cyclase (GGDEF)-like protein/PAS domain S-box-containing protein
MEAISLPMIVWNDQARAVYCNAAYAKYIHSTREDIVGKTVTEIFGLAVWERRQDGYYACLRGESVDDDRYIDSVEPPRWKRFLMRPLPNAEGVIRHVVVMVTDIDDDMRARDALLQSEQRFVRLTEAIDLPMGRWSADGRLLFFNKPYLAWSRRTEADLQGRHLWEIFGQEAWIQAKHSFALAFKGQTPSYDRLLWLPDGKSQWIRVKVFPEVDTNGNINAIYTIAFDIDADKRLHEELRDKSRRLDMFTSNIPFPLTYFDHGYVYRYVNKVFAQRHWLEAEMVIGQRIPDVRGAATWAEYEPYAKAALAGKEVAHERLVTMPDKSQRWTRTSYLPDIGEDGKVRGVYTATIDIHELKIAQQALQHSAERDALTDTYNRRFMLDAITTVAESPTPSMHALYFIDLDGFKQINDAHNHRAGDALLVHVVKQLRSALPAEALLGRFGGDEFVVLAPIVLAQDQAELGTDQATALALQTANGLVQAAAITLVFEGARLGVSASVGIALTPLHALSARELVRLADEAMYKAKRNGKNRAWMWGQA